METNKKEEMRERRKARRHHASFVEYCRVEDESSKKLQAFTENISSSGICIFSSEEIKTDSLLYITIYLLDGTNPIETKGRVAWIQPSVFLNMKDRKHFDIGLEFVDISKEDQGRLMHYVTMYPYEI